MRASPAVRCLPVFLHVSLRAAGLWTGLSARIWAVICILFWSGIGPAGAESWLSADRARLQTLDKITARIAPVELAIGQPVRLGTLEIWLDDCRYRPPEEPPEHAAFLRIYDRGYAGQNNEQNVEQAEAEQIFSGWMFASSPAISAMEHAVYDVTVIACSSTASTASSD